MHGMTQTKQSEVNASMKLKNGVMKDTTASRVVNSGAQSKDNKNGMGGSQAGWR